MPIIDIKAPLTLSDLFAALPGVFLLAGYLIALYFASRYVTTEVRVRQQTATYEAKQIKVWQPHPENEPQKDFYFYEVKSPALGSEGKPVLSFEDQTFIGRGDPRVIESRTRIVIPKIGDPPLKIGKREVVIPPQLGPYGPMLETSVSYTEVFYEPVVSYIETDLDEVKKSVMFDVGVDSEKYAIRGGVIGSVFSVLYFFIKGIIAARGNRAN